jgi:hypothetical protein
MNNDTPETNKAERMAFAQEYMAPTEFARKLERERDEALAEIKRLQKGGCARDQMTTQFCAEAVSSIRERDSAREEATRYRLLYYKQAGIDPDLGRLPWETKP